MSVEITYNQDVEPKSAKAPKRASVSRTFNGVPLIADITKKIGVGDDAKNSIVWVTIKWSFLVGSITTLAIYLRLFWTSADCRLELEKTLIRDVISAWSVFTPMITLALGYAFGKGK